MTSLALAAAVLSTAVIPASPPADRGLALRAGFYLGNDFNIGARTTHLEGFEVGADVRLMRHRIGEISLSPSVTLGGSNRSGADTDGNIYRVLVTLRRPVSGRAYVGGGLGWSSVQARVHEFSNVSGFATCLLVGTSFGQTGRGMAPFAEVAYHDGVDNKLRGWSLDLGVRF